MQLLSCPQCHIECQSWHWPLTPQHKINRVPLFIIRNWHVKFEIDWNNSVVYIVHTRYIWNGKVDLDLWTVTQNQDTSTYHPQLTCKVYIENDWIKTVVCIMPTRCQSLPWPLTPRRKISRVPLLIVHNWHVKYESDWAKTIIRFVPIRQSTHSLTHSLTHPLTLALTHTLTQSPDHTRTAALLQRCCYGIISIEAYQTILNT